MVDKPLYLSFSVIREGPAGALGRGGSKAMFFGIEKPAVDMENIDSSLVSVIDETRPGTEAVDVKEGEPP